MFEYVAIGIIIVLLVSLLITILSKNASKWKGSRHDENDDLIEVDKKELEILTGYVRAQKEHLEENQRLKNLKKAEMKQKLERFRQTREALKDKLARQLDRQRWVSLAPILKSADKGGVGIYILYNETKNKYYVGQAKQVLKRIREHFFVEDIALDYLNGNRISVKILNACDLDSDYRLDHIEKIGIELFDSDKSGYNRTSGNLF